MRQREGLWFSAWISARRCWLKRRRTFHRRAALFALLPDGCLSFGMPRTSRSVLFALGYAASPGDVLGEMARVARRVIVSDMHPLAVEAGWKRSFRTGHGVFEIDQYPHKVDEIDAAAYRAGLEKQWRIEAYFGPPERSLFEAAGKAHLYIQSRRVPAVLATGWVRR